MTPQCMLSVVAQEVVGEKEDSPTSLLLCTCASGFMRLQREEEEEDEEEELLNQFIGKVLSSSAACRFVNCRSICCVVGVGVCSV